MTTLPSAATHGGAASPAVHRLFAALVALHGLAHLVGTSEAFSAASDGGSLDYLGGAWDVSDPTVLRLLGVLWIVLGLAFVVAAALTWTGAPEWPRVLGAVAFASLVLVGLAVWASVVGVVINAALIAVAWRAAHR